MLQEIFEELKINESSTLSKLGATPEQVSAFYKQTASRSWWGDNVTIKANAEWSPMKSKKDTVDILKSDNATRSAVAGLATDGTLYVTVQTDSKKAWYGSGKDSYQTIELSPDGKVVNTWTDKTPNKAISHYKNVKTYFVGKNNVVRVKRKDQFYKDEISSTTVSDIADLIEKDVKVEIESTKKTLAKLIKDAADKFDFAKVYRYARRMVNEGSYWGDVSNVTFRDLVIGDRYRYRSIRDLIEAKIEELDIDLDDYESDKGVVIRKAGAKVLKDIKDDLKLYIQEIKDEE